MEKQEKTASLWHDAQGDFLPDYDREVIVLVQESKDFDAAGYTRVAFAHRPNPAGWDGKNIRTGKIEHFEAKSFGKGGWNWPDIKYWLDVELPNMEE